MGTRISRRATIFLVSSIVILSIVFAMVRIVAAWTGPTAAPPNNNVNAPINTGATSQIKSGDLSTNNFTAFGNILSSGLGNGGVGRYINFDYTNTGTVGGGSGGYGIWDNGGTLNFKNNGGSWQSLQTIINGLVPSSQWTVSGSNIYNANAGNVGIGTGATAPTGKLTIGNNVATGYLDTYGEYQEILYDGGSASASYGLGIKGNTVVFNSGAGAYSFDRGGAATTMTMDTAGKVGIGTAPSHQLHVVGPNSTGVDAIYAATGISDASTYAVYGAAGSYYGSLGRGDGYSFVGLGTLYNNGAAQATAFTYISDRTFKENIQPLDQGLVTLMKLRPVSFTWKKDTPLAGQNDIGLIAQEVEAILPGIVHTDNKGTKSIDYVRLTPVLVKAVQEQQRQIDELRADIQALKEKGSAGR